jgi:hypothetical protein
VSFGKDDFLNNEFFAFHALDIGDVETKAIVEAVVWGLADNKMEGQKIKRNSAMSRLVAFDDK